MKKLFLAAVAVSALSIASTAVIAGNHDGHDHGHKGKMMEKVDTDGDGKISKAEFMAKHESKFMKMDVDGDGFVSKDEMKDARAHKKEMMKEKMEKKMDKMKEKAY